MAGNDRERDTMRWACAPSLRLCGYLYLQGVVLG